MGDVDVEQRRGQPTTGVLLVGGHEDGRGLGIAEPLEVHGEEGHVGRDVAIAQLVVELDGVEDPRAVVEAEHVGGLQVAVPVADVAVEDPPVEQGGPSGEEPLDQGVGLGHVAGVEHRPDEAVELAPVRPPPPTEGLGGAEHVDGG